MCTKKGNPFPKDLISVGRHWQMWDYNNNKVGFFTTSFSSQLCVGVFSGRSVPLLDLEKGLSYPILLLKVTQTLSQCQNQGKVLWEHVHFGSIWSSWAIPCSLVIWKMGASHTSYLGMSLLVGHTELSSLSLLQGLCEGSTEQHAPGLVLLSLTQWEWRHTSFGIHTIKISRF